MSEDKLDDIRGGTGTRGRGRGFRAAAVCFSRQRTERRTWGGGAELRICLPECCLATILLWIITVGVGGLGSSTGQSWMEGGAGLKDVVALSCVELRVVSVRHDAAVLTVVHLRRFVLWQVSLIDGFFYLVICPFRIQVHRPAEVH